LKNASNYLQKKERELPNKKEHKNQDYTQRLNHKIFLPDENRDPTQYLFDAYIPN